jgi:uncharacterized membrane protein YbaN (DUF454 family)
MVLKHNLKRAVYVALASLFLIVGAAGIILPFLPALPFLLAASLLMSRGAKLFQ